MAGKLNPEELPKFFDEEFAKLVAINRSKGIPPQDAEDIAQESLIKVAINQEKIIPEQTDAYVATVNAHRRVDFWRSESRREKNLPSVPFEDEQTQIISGDVKPFSLEIERDISLTQALAQLTPDRREVFELTRKGLSDKEIAEKMGISENAVRSHRSRAIKDLRKLLLST